jgi:hypothetical protein
MGGSRWSEEDYHTSVQSSVVNHGTPFVHHANINSGKAAKGVHDDLDPRKLKDGRRESRDSAAHPDSTGVLVFLDVTGTMEAVVKQIHASLPQLMGLLTRKAYLADPQLCFCAVGDAVTDQAPLQVGQFESGAEMEGDLSKIWIEGQGGGQAMESYELGAYFGVHHTVLDCVENRGKLGYAFFIGDERPWPKVHAEHIRKWFGVGEAQDIPTTQIFKELQELYHVYFILPLGSSNGDRYKREWQDIIGAENVLVLSDPNACAELIAAQIGMCEGTVDMAGIRRDLTDLGSSNALVRSVESAVNTSATGRAALAQTDAFSGSSKTGNVQRL